MVFAYLFYLICLLTSIFTYHDIISWKKRHTVVKSLGLSSIDMNDIYAQKPLVQQHILYGLFQKYIFFVVLLIGLMSSQWMLFIGLFILRFVYSGVYSLNIVRDSKNYFTEILLPIVYRIIIIVGLIFICLNRFHLHLI